MSEKSAELLLPCQEDGNPEEKNLLALFWVFCLFVCLALQRWRMGRGLLQCTATFRRAGEGAVMLAALAAPRGVDGMQHLA